MQYQKTGQFANAEAAYKKVIALADDFAQAHNNLGNVLEEQGNLPAAISAYEKALELLPNNPLILNNLGNVCQKAGLLQTAQQRLEQAIKLKPDYASAYNNLGNIYSLQKNFPQATQAFETALQLNPNLASTWVNLASVHKAQHNAQLAITSLANALNIDPALLAAHKLSGYLHKAMGQYTKAVEHFEYCLHQDSTDLESASVLFHLYSQTFSLGKVSRIKQTLTSLLNNIDACSSLANPFSLLSYTDDPDLHLNVATAYSRKITATLNKSADIVSRATNAISHNKLRIGYLSSDFRDHPLSHLIMGLFREHNHDQFDIYCYSQGPVDNGYYQQTIIHYADSFQNVSGLSDEQAARKIANDKIDILVDLNGHTANSRLGICAYRPARIQITYLGFPGTSGADFFDYLISDNVVTPLTAQQYYSEKFLFMPNTYQATDNQQPISKVRFTRSDFNLPDDAFIFCSFNQIYKIDKQIFTLWMQILSKVENSLLWLLASNQDTRRNITDYAQTLGIEKQRIIFAEKLAKDKHLKRMGLADLALDTITCNGHTTTSDALWAGLPVVALRGHHFASRVSASLLQAADLSELVTDNLADYQALAISLANTPSQLATIRSDLNKNRSQTSLFDTPRFTQQLEALYKAAYQRACNGLAPAHLDNAKPN